MEEINISFIIPIFNTENYINRCVLSIIRNYPQSDYEIILINDGSSDNSASICNALSTEYKNVRTIHITNAGVSNARNVGIKEAKGKWISFIDSDDFIEEGFNLLSLYLQDPEIELIHYGWKYISDTIKYYPVSDQVEILTCKELFKRKIFHGYVWSYIFKKEIISKYRISFSTDMKYAEDWEFIFKYYSFLEKKTVLLNKYIYNQTCREGSATNQKLGEKYICDNFKMYKNTLSLSSNSSTYLKNCIIYHLYAINIWMINNIIFDNYQDLIKVYTRNIKHMVQKKFLGFILSPIILYPILFNNKSVYYLLIKLYKKKFQLR